MKELKLPDFFIVGAPKAGTTSLFHYLQSHPKIFMCPLKEPNYFAYEEISRNKLYYKQKSVKTLPEYEELFINAGQQQVIGEASVSYLFYPGTAAHIKELIPRAKIIIILRNPADRAFSHYLMDKRLGYIRASFEDVIYKNKNLKNILLYYQQYVDLGFYFAQVNRYIQSFLPEQIKIFVFEELSQNFSHVIKSTLQFLGVSDEYVPEVYKRINVHAESKNALIRFLYPVSLLRKTFNRLLPLKWQMSLKQSLFELDEKPEIRKETRDHLNSLYRNSIEALETLIEKDLSIWYR
jgi:hypothetical protein